MGQISSILVSMGVTDLQIGLAKMLWGIDEEQIEVRISELEYRPPKLSIGVVIYVPSLEK